MSFFYTYSRIKRNVRALPSTSLILIVHVYFFVCHRAVVFNLLTEVIIPKQGLLADPPVNMEGRRLALPVNHSVNHQQKGILRRLLYFVFWSTFCLGKNDLFLRFQLLFLCIDRTINQLCPLWE